MRRPTELEVLRGDITALDVDAVVNAANAALAGGGGVDGAIHRAGGPSIMAECRTIGGCAPGDAVATTAGDLPARWVIHTVGPIWDPDDPDGGDRVLASAYRRSLEVATELGARSVAFPNISTGVYGFPKPRAADVAVGAVTAWLDEREGSGADGVPPVDRIVFVCFDDENERLYRERLSSWPNPR